MSSPQIVGNVSWSNRPRAQTNTAYTDRIVASMCGASDVGPTTHRSAQHTHRAVAFVRSTECLQFIANGTKTRARGLSTRRLMCNASGPRTCIVQANCTWNLVGYELTVSVLIGLFNMSIRRDRLPRSTVRVEIYARVCGCYSLWREKQRALE